MGNVENRIAQVEKFFNPIDYIPGISGLSGMTRLLAGMIQTIAGVAFAALKVFQIILTGRGNYSQVIKQGLTYSLHGLGNIGRGCVALLPIVNCFLLVYDKYVGRMNYNHEVVSPNVYPIMTAHRLVALYY
jgi:hypothetical protein